MLTSIWWPFRNVNLSTLEPSGMVPNKVFSEVRRAAGGSFVDMLLLIALGTPLRQGASTEVSVSVSVGNVSACRRGGVSAIFNCSRARVRFFLSSSPHARSPVKHRSTMRTEQRLDDLCPFTLSRHHPGCTTIAAGEALRDRSTVQKANVAWASCLCSFAPSSNV
jgi:hypothetical protein